MLSGQEKRDIKIAFYKKFGVQRIDLASYSKTDDANFKKIALMEGVQLNIREIRNQIAHDYVNDNINTFYKEI